MIKKDKRTFVNVVCILYNGNNFTYGTGFVLPWAGSCGWDSVGGILWNPSAGSHLTLNQGNEKDENDEYV